MTADDVKRLLGLAPLTPEGGWFIESYRADQRLSAVAPARGERALATAIYYLLTPETFSAIHRLPADEIFHFYAGDPVELLMLMPGGRGCTARLGVDLAAGMRPQIVVPKGVWQGSRLEPGGRWALLGTTVSPGFDVADFESGSREALVRAYPAWSERIVSLTRAASTT